MAQSETLWCENKNFVIEESHKRILEGCYPASSSILIYLVHEIKQNYKDKRKLINRVEVCSMQISAISVVRNGWVIFDT